MNAIEANALIAKIGLLDRWFKRSPQEQADTADSWSHLLADVPAQVAGAAVEAHYATERRSIMPADIIEFAEEQDNGRNLTVEREMRERDAWLSERGIDPVEWDRLLTAGVKPATILARHGVSLTAVTA